MARRNRRAFTLVELLVVITIIGMLMALLLPAVNAAVEAARRGRCASRLKGLATGAISYDGRMKRYPGYRNSIGEMGNAKNPMVEVGWLVMMLEDMSRKDLKDKYVDLLQGRSETFNFPYLDWLECPSDPPDQRPTSKQSYSAYIGNAGLAKQGSGAGVTDNPADGIFLNASSRNNLRPVNTRSAYVTGADGVTNTLLFSENVAAANNLGDQAAGGGGWHTPGGATGTKDAEKIYTVFVWYDNNGVTPSPVGRVNGVPQAGAGNTVQLADVQLQNFPEAARPSSFHPGGANAAFCDGHVVLLRQDMGYHVYTQLMTVDNQRCSIPGNKASIVREYVLSSDDYTSN